MADAPDAPRAPAPAPGHARDYVGLQVDLDIILALLDSYGPLDWDLPESDKLKDVVDHLRLGLDKLGKQKQTLKTSLRKTVACHQEAESSRQDLEFSGREFNANQLVATTCRIAADIGKFESGLAKFIRQEAETAQMEQQTSEAARTASGLPEFFRQTAEQFHLAATTWKDVVMSKQQTAKRKRQDYEAARQETDVEYKKYLEMQQPTSEAVRKFTERMVQLDGHQAKRFNDLHAKLQQKAKTSREEAEAMLREEAEAMLREEEMADVSQILIKLVGDFSTQAGNDELNQADTVLLAMYAFCEGRSPDQEDRWVVKTSDLECTQNRSVVSTLKTGGLIEPANPTAKDGRYRITELGQKRGHRLNHSSTA